MSQLNPNELTRVRSTPRETSSYGDPGPRPFSRNRKGQKASTAILSKRVKTPRTQGSRGTAGGGLGIAMHKPLGTRTRSLSLPSGCPHPRDCDSLSDTCGPGVPGAGRSVSVPDFLSLPRDRPPILGSVTGQPPSVGGQPPSVTGQPPSVTGQPPSVTGRPPSVTGQPPSVGGQPLSVGGQPLSVGRQPLLVGVPLPFQSEPW